MYVDTLMAKDRLWVNLAGVWEELEQKTGRDLTNDAISKEVGVSKNTVSAYRNGTIQRPRLEILFRLRDFFATHLGRKISIEDLVEWETERGTTK